MKVLIVNKFLHPNGGSETYIFKLGEELKKQGHEVQYFGMEHEKRIVGNHAGCYTANMDFHTGKLQKLLYPFKIIYSREAKQKMYTVLQDMQPDVVHLNNFNFQLTPSIIYAIKKYNKRYGKNVRLVYTAHDSQLVCPNHLMQNPITRECCEACLTKGVGQCAKRKCIHGSRIKSLLGTIEAKLYKMRKTYRMIDTIICPSRFLKEKLDSDAILRERTVVLHNFVDRQMDTTGLEKKEYVLYFGRYSEEKGIRTLASACKELPEIPFHFAGGGPLEAELKALPNVELLGFLSGEALVKEIAQASFVVFPSEWYENCPYTVIESQIYGTPVIASNKGGTPELIEDGQTGELFESGNVQVLSDMIHTLWQDREKLARYTENCKNVQFDNAKQYVEKLMKIYQ